MINGFINFLLNGVITCFIKVGCFYQKKAIVGYSIQKTEKSGAILKFPALFMVSLPQKNMLYCIIIKLA